MDTLAEVESKVIEFSLEDQLQLLALLAECIRNKTQAKSEKKAHRKLGGFEGKIWISPDFDETPNCFAEYM